MLITRCSCMKNEKINKCSKYERQVSAASSSSSTSKEAPNTHKIDIILTGKGLQLYETWSKTMLLKLLTNRLKRSIHVQSNLSPKICGDPKNDERLQIAISKGLYSNYVLKKLQEKGMSMYSILKAMKLGLISLNCCELCYFKDFNVDLYILEFKEMWSNKLSDELILNLKPVGLTDLECWNIIVYGVMIQKSNIIYRLTLSGIDVPGILNWQSAINFASSEIIEFLKHIGIKSYIVRQVEKYGIDEETEQMLIDIGFNEMKDQFSKMEEVVCEYKLTMVESDTCNLEKTQEVCETNNLKSTSSSTDTINYFQQHACQCHLLAENISATELTAQRNDYLRQNIMVPLAWGIAKALDYKPTDPIHYLAYQLLRWTCNVSELTKDSVQQLIALATIKMDRKLIEEKRLEEELIRKLKEESMKNTVCKDPPELQHIKQRNLKCKRMSSKKYEICKFPERCSSCKINVSHNSG